MIASFRREWKNFFCRWNGYLFLGLFWSLTGIFMLVYNFYYGYTGFEYPLYLLTVCLASLLPLVTVPLFREERRAGVGRFLRSLPLSAKELVLGKYTSVVAALAVVTVGMAICPILLRMYGEIAYGAAYSGVLAFFLLGWAFLSVEVFLSLMIRNSVILWIASYCVPAVGIGLGYLASVLPEGVGEVVSYLSLFGAYTPFLYGLLDWRSLILWATVAIVFAVLTVRYAKRMLQA